MELNLFNFFNTVLPTTGVYALVTRSAGENYMKHTPHANIDALVADVMPFGGMRQADTWFALAGFKQGFYVTTNSSGEQVKKFRTKENAQHLRSLFLDVDVGDGKGYPSTVEALQALKAFCVATQIEQPTIVLSGSGGLHLYWSFDRDLPVAEWQVLADALHNATVRHGFNTDPVRTRDCASMPRVPNTLNFKTNPPNKVQLLHIEPQKAVSYFQERLAPYTTGTSVADTAWEFDTSVYGPLPNVHIPLHEIKQEIPARPAEEVVAQCPQIQQQKDAPEPVWRGMLAVMRHCEGGREMAHTLSKQDARYDYNDTEHKLQQLANNDIAPYTCVTFDRLRPEVCHKCPHKGHIKSPISVPTSKISVVQIDEETGEVEKVPTVETVADVVTETVVHEIPNIETKRYRVNETGCYAYIQKDEDTGFWKCFYPYPVYPIQRIRDRTASNEIEMSYVFRKHHRSGYDDFQIMGDVLMGQGVNGFLGSVGFLLDNNERKHMVGFMIDLLKEVGAELEETSTMDKLGWSENMKTFLLGNKLYKTNGQVVEVSPKGYAADYSQRTAPKGDLETWKKIANVYNRKGLEWGQLAVASAFASPIMCIGSLERAALLFLTGEKGAGKSTALYLAVSVFGDPTRLLVNKDDTYLSRIAKLGIMSNISVGFDEMTDMSPKEASELAYQITQGRGKDRMADGGKGIQHNKTFWSCLPIMSANDSIINALSQHSFDATAQMSRVLEVKATSINHVYTPEEFDECEKLVRKLPHNYGVAGDVYMRWVTANLDKLEDMIYKTEKLFIQRTGLNNNYRFWTYMCTRMLVGVMIANKLGLLDYDVEALFEYMANLCKASRARISRQNVDVNTVLGSFLAEHTGNRIVVKSDKRPPTMPFLPETGVANDIGYVLQPLATGRDLHIRVARDERLMFISKKAIRDWCVKTGTPEDKFMQSVQENAYIVEDKQRVVLGRQTQWHELGRVNCIVIRMNEDIEFECGELEPEGLKTPA